MKAFISVALLWATALQGAGLALPAPPVAPQVQHTVKGPQGERSDPYHWLRDDHAKAKRPEVMQHLRAENAYTAARLKPLQGLQATLLKELKAREVPNDAGVPAYRNGWWWWERYRPGAEHPQLVARPGSPEGPLPGSREQVLLDMAQRARGSVFYALGHWALSPDGSHLAWLEDRSGQRRHTLHVRAIAPDRSAAPVQDTGVTGALDELAWANDNRTLFYIRQDPVTLQSGPIWRHRVGSPTSTDVMVLDEADKTMFSTLRRSASGRFVVLNLESEDTSEMQVVDADRPDTPARALLPRRTGVRLQADHIGAWWVVRSNHAPDGSKVPNYGLWAVPAGPGDPAERSTWQLLRAPQPEARLDSFALLERGVAFTEVADAHTRVRLLRGDMLAATEPGAPMLATRLVELPIGGAPGQTADLTPGPDARVRQLRWTLTSMVQPVTTLDTDIASGTVVERKRQRVPGFDPQHYRSTRIWATARDGALVPVSLGWRVPGNADTPRNDGSAPLLVQGYGAYGHSYDPRFRKSRLSLLDRGFVLAIVHVRGGAELGEAWYEGGKLFNKRNSFNDFVDATKALVAAGWGAPDKVFAEGGSAGGLLMGVVANEAGVLYRGIVMQVPFVDVVTTMLDETIPLTTQEWSQWGDPRKAADHAYMLGYSPYDNLRAQPYPPMLVSTGLWDSQVGYFEPAKYVARLRTLKTNPAAPLLLHTSLGAGHGGDSGRYAALAEVARELAFMVDLAAGLRSKLMPVSVPVSVPTSSAKP